MTIIVLASTSPYRKALLEKLQLPFQTAAPNIDETPLPHEQAPALVKRLAEQKAQKVAEQYDDALIIGSDQVAVIDDQILGKPGDVNRAVEQLKRASGKTVLFYTGLALYNTRTQRQQSDVSEFQVRFRTLSTNAIKNYIAKERPLDSAGSFKSEGLGIALFQAMQGDDPNSLIGLPLIRLIDMLNQEGIDILS